MTAWTKFRSHVRPMAELSVPPQVNSFASDVLPIYGFAVLRQLRTIGVRGEDRLRKSSLLGDMPAAQRGSRPVLSNKLRQRDANNPDADKGPFRLFPVTLPK